MIRHGTPEFRHTTLALFSAGFATFALLYSVQPLMPVFARDFHVSATASSLSLSLTTGLLAPAMVVAGILSESRGRKAIMVASLFSSSLLMFVSAFAPRWELFLAARALAGITFAGLPASSMAYLSEEMHPTSIGLAMGLAIGGNGLGGMCGRLATGLLSDFVSWRVALAGVAMVGFVATAIFWRALPPSRHFTPRPLRVRPMASAFRDALRDPGLAPLYANGFIFMGSLIATYNYVTYHLLAPPYSLRQSVVGSIFIVYLLGIVASAWAGAAAARVGRARMVISMFALMLVGFGLTLMRPLVCVILGITAVTCGFFGGHSTTSTWVGLRATRNKAQASALYMFFFYIGSSLAGSLGGVFWTRWQWPGVVGFVTTLVLFGVGMVLVARERWVIALPPDGVASGSSA